MFSTPNNVQIKAHRIDSLEIKLAKWFTHWCSINEDATIWLRNRVHIWSSSLCRKSFPATLEDIEKGIEQCTNLDLKDQLEIVYYAGLTEVSGH